MEEDENEDAIIERVAKAMQETHENSLLEAVGEKEFDSEEMTRFFQYLTFETDRGLAIVSFAYMDAILANLFEGEVNDQIPGGARSLFRMGGPLESASARIKMAAALYWISPDVMRDLNFFRKIRNQFAHHPFSSGFGDQVVAGYLSEITPRENVHYNNGASDSLIEKSKLTPRQIFHVRAATTCCQMIMQMLSSPRATKMGLSPSTLHDVGYEKLPTNTSVRLKIE